MADTPMPTLPAMPPSMPQAGFGAAGMDEPMPPPSPQGVAAQPSQAFVPLSLVADIKIAGGPPMVRDEGGLLVGYVYVDIDQGERDIGGYVDEAKEVVRKASERGELKIPTGYFLKWTGQYELLEQMTARMKIVIPVTLLIIVILLYFQFRNITEALIVLLSIPFALVGSVWLMWILDYRISTAVWVGVIALVGLAAQTGIVMIVYINHAYERRLKEGRIHGLPDIIAAHMEGTVLRVRPKVMTVSTMLIGLVPLLWATGSGADVMKRVAVPMIGGLITSAFLTLEIIPVVVTYWRREQLLWRRLAEIEPKRLTPLKSLLVVQVIAWAVALTAAVAPIYVRVNASGIHAVLAIAVVVAVVGGFGYGVFHRPAKRVVWPDDAPAA